MAGSAASRSTLTRANAEGPLCGCRYDFGAQADLADRYAAQLLSALGADVAPLETGVDPCDAARDWAQSGLLPLIGYADGPPLPGPAALASCANGVLRALRAMSDKPCLPDIDGSRLLSERAAYLDFRRQGQTSANGSCRLLRAANDWLAVNLARNADWDLLPAWINADVAHGDWDAVAEALRDRPAAPLIERGRLLGLPLALPRGAEMAPGWFRVHKQGDRVPMRTASAAPLVVNLSSLWAGPLCSHLLQQTGARIIKVESLQRPEGARGGNREFFDLLNGGKASVALDFASQGGRTQLRELLQRADIVIESSRPRALAQLGIDVEALVEARPGLVWISITGYGRVEPNALWVAFGDDAAVAAGVARAVADPPVFCGDALADPLSGMHAALAGLAYWRGGSGALLDVSLCQVVAHCLHALPGAPSHIVCEGEQWLVAADDRRWPVAEPQRRIACGTAPAFGADTIRILEEFGIPC